MKRMLSTFASFPILAGMVTLDAHSQGTVLFSNLSASNCYAFCAADLNCPLVCNGTTGTLVPAGGAFKAALFYLPYNGEADAGTVYPRFSAEAIQIGPSVDMVLPGRFNGGIVTTPVTTPPGGEAWFAVRVWESAFGDTYEQARNSTNVVNGRRGLMNGYHHGVVKVQTGNPGIPTPPGGFDASLLALTLEPNEGSLVSVDDVTVSLGTTGTVNAIFTVRVGPYTCVPDPGGVLHCSGQGASVRFATADCSAVGGVDYQPVSGTFDFGAWSSGEERLTVSIPVVVSPNHSLRNKKFFLNLNSLDATFLKAQAICEILPATGPTACASAPCGLVSWWPGTSNANDIVGSYNGVLQNGVGFAAGKAGQAFSFNGSDAHLRFSPSLGNFGTSGFTVEFWLKTSSTRTEIVMSKRAICDYSSFWQINLDASGVLVCELDQSSAANYSSFASTTHVNNGQFHHVALVRQGATARIYIDGVQEGSATGPVTANLSNGAEFLIGRDVCFPNYFTGLMDEISIYNRALSAAEIQAIYSAQGAGKCLNPLYITSVNRTGNVVNLSWSAQKGMGYRVQYTTNLNASPWSSLPPDVTATNSTASQTDSTLGDAPQRFYRVQLLQ